MFLAISLYTALQMDEVCRTQRGDIVCCFMRILVGLCWEMLFKVMLRTEQQVNYGYIWKWKYFTNTSDSEL